MKKASFPTPQDAEAAFYEALEQGNLEAMMEVWSDDEEIVCVHPGGPRLCGFDQVRDSWALIFKSGGQSKIHLTDQVVVQGMMFSIHSQHENVFAPGAVPGRAAAVVTNVFQRSAGGWRMIVHHASPAPRPPAARPEPALKTLH